jgi:hypothetical protein
MILYIHNLEQRVGLQSPDTYTRKVEQRVGLWPQYTPEKLRYHLLVFTDPTHPKPGFSLNCPGHLLSAIKEDLGLPSGYMPDIRADTCEAFIQYF